MCIRDSNGRSLFTDRDSSTELVLIGGEVIGNTKMGNAKMYTTGTLAVEAIEKISATKCILGVSGISAKGGLTSMAVQDPAVNPVSYTHLHPPVFSYAHPPYLFCQFQHTLQRFFIRFRLGFCHLYFIFAGFKHMFDLF